MANQSSEIARLTSLLYLAKQDAKALRGYRAATYWIGADSWDGCSDCIRVLQGATNADLNRDMTPDEIAAALKEIRPHQPAPNPSSEIAP